MLVRLECPGCSPVLATAWSVNERQDDMTPRRSAQLLSPLASSPRPCGKRPRRCCPGQPDSSMASIASRCRWPSGCFRLKGALRCWPLHTQRPDCPIRVLATCPRHCGGAFHWAVRGLPSTLFREYRTFYCGAHLRPRHEPTDRDRATLWSAAWHAGKPSPVHDPRLQPGDRRLAPGSHRYP